MGKIDKGKAFELYSKGVKKSDIAKHFNVYPSAVNNAINRMRKHLTILPELEEWRKKQVDILDSSALVFLGAAREPGKLKKASSLQLSTAACQCIDKSQLLQGKATSRTEVLAFTPEDREELRMLRALDITPSTQDVVEDSQSPEVVSNATVDEKLND